jgi:carbamoyltransferase
MRVLGISAFYHDSAATLVEDGRIVAAAQEERFTRKKHDPPFLKSAIAYSLEEAGTRLDELDHVVFYDKPFLKFERLLETYVALARGFRSFRMAMPLWLKEKLFQKSLLKGELKQFAEKAYPNQFMQILGIYYLEQISLGLNRGGFPTVCQ